MSRAFTSEEYEARDVQFVIPEKKEKSADEDLVFAYSKGRDLADPSLPYEIGMHFLKGDEGFFQSEEFAMKWLDKAIRMGHAPAMLLLADHYLSDTKTHGYRKAAQLVSKAASLGDADAVSRLDMTSIEDPSTKKAFTTYRLNAELGNVDAMLALARGFEKGLYGAGREKAAAAMYTRAFKAGDDDAAKRVLALYYKKKIELTAEELAFLRSRE